MILTFSGVDCSGKSTQIELLKQTMEARGRRTTVFWLRPGYSDELNAMRKLARRLVPRALPTSEDSAARERAFSGKGVSETWVTAALADSIFQYGAKVRALSLAGRVVICDRWLDDAALDFAFRFPEMQVDRWLLSRILRRVVPRPRVSFLLMLGHDEMLRRMAIKDEPFPDPPEIRDARYAEYVALSRGGHYRVLDGEREPEAVHAAVLDALPGRW